MDVNPDGTTALLTAIFTGTPSLPDAACSRQVGLFDDRHPDETAEQRRHRFEAAARGLRTLPGSVRVPVRR